MIIRALLLIILGGAAVIGAALYLPKTSLAEIYTTLHMYDTAVQIAYAAKLDNPDYRNWQSTANEQKAPQDFYEERLIKSIRSQAAKNIRVPKQAKVHNIPIDREMIPRVDGVIDSSEWATALHIPIGTPGKNATLLTISDGTWLYVACDAVSEVTPEGFDQFRFYLHVGTTQSIANERIHVRAENNSFSPLRSIRRTNLRFSKPEADRQKRIREKSLSDWSIYHLANGATKMEKKHRQYEAAINMDEAGLFSSIPFPAYAEVESDGEYDKSGKFVRRTYVGKFPLHKKQAWFVIGKPKSE